MTTDENEPLPVAEGADELLAGRTPPHNLEAEEGVLGGLLLSPQRWDLVEGRISREDFFSPAYGIIFESIETLCKKGQPIDLLVLRDQLVSQGQFEAVGGTAALAALVEAVPSGAHVEYYAEIVKEKATLRRLMETSAEIIARAGSSREPAGEIMDFAERSIFEVATRGVTGEATDAATLLKETWEKIEKMQAEGGNRLVTGLATGFYRMDELTAGLHPDELIIIAGRPGMGKSTFALNLLRHIACDYQQGAVFYTLEMSGDNIMRNLMAAQGRVEAQHLRRMQLSHEEISRLIQASDVLRNAPIFVDDTPAISLSELRGKTRRLKARYDIKICFIDYLQLMTASATARGRSREQEVSEISRGLKALAKELQIPVIALSQLSRKPEGRADNRPVLSDLRESGAIEQDADMVILLHRPDYYKSSEDRDRDGSNNLAEVIIAKQRNGPTDSFEAVFLNQFLRFENATLRPDEGYRPHDEEM